MFKPKFFIVYLINIVGSLMQVLLGLRLILKMFGASTTAPFVTWVYETTNPLLTPFIGIFPSPQLTGGFQIEFSVLFAIIVYSFLFYLMQELFSSIELFKVKETSKKSAKK